MHAGTHGHQPVTPLSGILFLEDFEPGEAPPAPAPVAPAPALTDADLARAREAAHAEGYEQGLAQARSEGAEATGRALETIAAFMHSVGETAARAAESHAKAVAALLLATLGALLPRLSDRFGAEEAAAIALALRPGLRHQPAICVRAHPRTCAPIAAAMTEALRDLDPELCARMRFVEAPAMLPGDVRIEWDDGAAVRDTAALWADVAAILSPLDLLDAGALPLARAA